MAFGHTPRIILSTCILVGALCAADVPATLQVSSTTVPPGGMAQIRISLASPQPISHGAFSIDLDPAFFGDIADVQVFSAAGDAVGTAAINGRHVDVQFSSPSGGVGRLPDLPLAAVAVPILPNVAPGASGAFTLDPGATRWLSPNNSVYMLAVQPGSVIAGDSLAIANVTPGGGLLPAGTVVRVMGFGFKPDTVINVPGVAIAATTYAGPAEIDFTLAGATELTGKRVRATNVDGSAAAYVSALRAIPADPATTRLLPIFPLRTYPSIQTSIVPNGLGGNRGIALENQNTTAVDVQVDLLGVGSLVRGNTIILPPGGVLVVQSLTDLGVGTFGSAGLLASKPIRAILLSRSIYPFSVLTASEVTAGYARSSGLPLRVSPASLSFHSQTGGAAPDPQKISVAMTYYFGVDFTASALTNTGGA